MLFECGPEIIGRARVRQGQEHLPVQDAATPPAQRQASPAAEPAPAGDGAPAAP